MYSDTRQRGLRTVEWMILPWVLGRGVFVCCGVCRGLCVYWGGLLLEFVCVYTVE